MQNHGLEMSHGVHRTKEKTTILEYYEFQNHSLLHPNTSWHSKTKLFHKTIVFF